MSEPDAGRIRVEPDGPVATIVIDRPATRNSLTAAMKADLLAALTTIGRDGAVRAVVVTGAPGAFCAGQDLGERLAPDAIPLETEVRERYGPLVLAIRRLPQPVIAAIGGVAAGAGAGLALAADLRIAAERASFVLAFGRLGLVPDTGLTWLLPRIVGFGRAMELALVGDPLPAAEAERIGLVHRVVPDDAVLPEARALAARLALGSSSSLALTKRALWRAMESDLPAALEDEAILQGIAGRAPDHAEGLRAFAAKRPPRFAGATDPRPAPGDGGSA